MAAATTTTASKTTTTASEATTKMNETAKNVAEDFTAAAQDQFRKMTEMFTGNAEDMRAQAETLTEEMRVRMEKTQKHVADANAELVEAARTEMSDAVQFANDLASAKSFADALTVQQNYWTSLFQSRIERTQDITQNSVDVARESLKPVNASFGSMFDQSKMFGAFFPSKA